MTEISITELNTCSTCEFFDGGGIKADGTWKEQSGDCHNRHSPRFQTSVGATCEHYFRDDELIDAMTDARRQHNNGDTAK